MAREPGLGEPSVGGVAYSEKDKVESEDTESTTDSSDQIVQLGRPRTIFELEEVISNKVRTSSTGANPHRLTSPNIPHKAVKNGQNSPSAKDEPN